MSVERVYVGDETGFVRVAPDLAVWVRPGDTVEFDEAPDDPKFLTAAAAAKRSHSKADTGESEEQA